MANVTCPACSLPNPDTYSKCRRCGTALSASDSGQGVWRDGTVLVVKKDAPLPDRCVLCNTAAGGRGVKRTFYWHHPALYLLAFVALILYAIVALVVRKSATVFVGLCPNHADKRRRARIGGWLLAVAGIVALFVAIEHGAVFGWTGLAMLLGAGIWGTLAGRGLRPERIDDQFARFRGACPAYLGQLPSWSSYT